MPEVLLSFVLLVLIIMTCDLQLLCPQLIERACAVDRVSPNQDTIELSACDRVV